jgi:hypothetical protein
VPHDHGRVHGAGAGATGDPDAQLRLVKHTVQYAVPIRGETRLLGCINAIWMARVISAEEGVRGGLGSLRETQALIEGPLAEASRR